MRILALALLFMPLSAVPQEKVAGCPEGLICLTQPQAAAIVQRFNQMAATLDQAATMIEEQEKALADLRAKKACT